MVWKLFLLVVIQLIHKQRDAERELPFRLLQRVSQTNHHASYFAASRITRHFGRVIIVNADLAQIELWVSLVLRISMGGNCIKQNLAFFSVGVLAHVVEYDDFES